MSSYEVGQAQRGEPSYNAKTQFWGLVMVLGILGVLFLFANNRSGGEEDIALMPTQPDFWLSGELEVNPVAAEYNTLPISVAQATTQEEVFYVGIEGSDRISDPLRFQDLWVAIGGNSFQYMSDDRRSVKGIEVLPWHQPFQGTGSPNLDAILGAAWPVNPQLNSERIVAGALREFVMRSPKGCPEITAILFNQDAAIESTQSGEMPPQDQTYPVVGLDREDIQDYLEGTLVILRATVRGDTDCFTQAYLEASSLYQELEAATRQSWPQPPTLAP